MIDVITKIASYGTVFAIVAGCIFAFFGYAAASLSYGSTAWTQAWWALRGGVFGLWIVFTPFALWDIFSNWR